MPRDLAPPAEDEPMEEQPHWGMVADDHQSPDLTPTLGHSHSIAASDFSQTWQNLSPFSESRLYQLTSFSVANIKAMLDQYQDQYDEAHGLCFFSNIQELAEAVHRKTSGYPGLIGIALHEAVSQEIRTLEAWIDFSGPDLVRRVLMQRNYSLIASVLSTLSASTDWPQLASTLQSLLLYGRAEISRQHRCTVAELLLSDGVAVMKSSLQDKLEV